MNLQENREPNSSCRNLNNNSLQQVYKRSGWLVLKSKFQASIPCKDFGNLFLNINRHRYLASILVDTKNTMKVLDPETYNWSPLQRQYPETEPKPRLSELIKQFQFFEKCYRPEIFSKVLCSASRRGTVFVVIRQRPDLSQFE
ncbi:hypothetical protein M0812_05196 [Anaeramoeba flamelloides]|uniref:Uncharacterized protein n=1 Tax=Anaeramoeba flamelloides TaxID=1746091 RepID=A0AAV8A4J6_9EUKA|nr:hypothetical protein M0812_05196 [Anaeramoeba flamelloides]|eukprot:Anaeramoba_flamelloidesc43009_g6_i2.p1 GENE.c43009_g6_i2~~c43009_g6_i2.p1  ORF type:complete len:143 (-),score=12.86 c43009_g6_i2:193-621(-)